MKIIINYDTVSFVSQIECTDKVIENNLKQSIEENKDKRITDWFEGFIKGVKDATNNDKFSIEIYGCDSYEKDFIESILEIEKNFINKRKINFIDDRRVMERHNAVDAFIDYTLKSNEPIITNAIKPNQDRVKSLRSNKVEVPVIATMSSGKSTLLNAILGKNILFEDTGTATGTICTIKIKDSDKFTARAIKGNKILDETSDEIKPFFEKWNTYANKEKDPELELCLEGPIKDLNSSGMELNFIDTPGPNSAQFENHKLKTQGYLKDNQDLPIVLYVLDPEKMDSNDDNFTLKAISNQFKEQKQNLDRIVFIYNKVDCEKLGNKSFSEILEKVYKFLGKFGIKNPCVFPISSSYAKLAQLNGTLNHDEVGELTGYRHKFTPVPEKNYKGYQLIDYAPLTIKQKAHLKERITKSELDADLVYSGLAALKLYIEDYIANHHQKIQYRDLMSIANNVFDEIKSKIDLEKKNLEEKTVDEQKKIEERKKKEEEELSIRKDQALQEIASVKVNKKFIQDATRKTDQAFDKLKAKSTKTNLSPFEAKRLVEWVNNTISELEVSVKTDIVAKINDEGQNYLQNLKKKVGNKFNLKNQSFEQKSFNAQLLNKINILDIKQINGYKETETENKQRTVEEKVKSEKWYKRLFGIEDTIVYIEVYSIETTVINVSKFYNDKIEPKIKEFEALIKNCENASEKIFQEYNIAFQTLVKKSFEESKNSVYKTSDDELTRNEKEIQNELQKLIEISNTILKFKIQ
ncbi:hypothetical protein EI546_03520 [Aequorivita sp. H23M31]|uniref:Dynamin N-terminal domain-containing protein n=1 Tax=Aequorivita ciconiae TaxID=2494375 RepID=A0A410G0Q6_9FLAO|nr:dynamin family protein [Aequorivita sp. H23M31]QAA80854.1 hypothetical protein EI546_03520 [Aequorivita sp. H23M31]